MSDSDIPQRLTSFARLINTASEKILEQERLCFKSEKFNKKSKYYFSPKLMFKFNRNETW